MAIGRIELSAEIVGLRQVQANIRTAFRPQKRATIIERAMEKALVPVKSALQRTTPLGPTGNLRRAIDTKVVPYPFDGNAVGIVGFRRTGKRQSRSAAGGSVRIGPDRAFHQWWLEEGTRDRYIGTVANIGFFRRAHIRKGKDGSEFAVRGHQVARQGGYIASSYRELGPFRFRRDESRPDRVVTDPAYPKAFFRKSSKPIVITGVTPGGVSGQPPLQAAFNETQSTVAEILSRELRIALEDIWSGLTTSTSAIGTIDQQ